MQLRHLIPHIVESSILQMYEYLWLSYTTIIKKLFPMKIFD